MTGIEEIQVILKHNFETYANTRVEMLERLEREYGRLFVHFGGSKYEDWYYYLYDGVILFGFSSEGRFLTELPEQHVCVLKIEPCNVEDFEKAFNESLAICENKPMYRPKEETIKWVREKIRLVKDKK
jgi:uncharacterized protein (UPF0371 family)